MPPYTTYPEGPPPPSHSLPPIIDPSGGVGGGGGGGGGGYGYSKQRPGSSYSSYSSAPSISPPIPHAGLPQSQANGAWNNSRTTAPLAAAAAASRSSFRAIRPLSVGEALQYSPFSSIVPLDSSIISLPTAGIVPSSYPLFPNAAEQQNARRALEHLDRAADRMGQEREISNALGSVQRLLDRDKVTEYVFKAPSSHVSSGVRKSTSQSAGGLKKLSSFANMVLKATDIAYKYPAVKSAEHASSKPKPAVAAKKPSPHPLPLNTPITPRHIQENKEAYAQNAQISIQAPQTVTPDQLSLQPQNVVPSATLSRKPDEYKVYQEPLVKNEEPPQTIAPSAILLREPEDGRAYQRPSVKTEPESKIVIPSANLSRKLDEYKVYQEPPVIEKKELEAPPTTIAPEQLQLQPRVVISSATLSNDASEYKVYRQEPDLSPAKPLKRKHDQIDDLETIDQRAISNTIVQTFLAFLSEVFEAEDSFHIDGVRPGFDNYFIQVRETEGELLVMAPAIQVKLDSSLYKVMNHGRLRDVPLESIKHIQKLCEAAMRAAESTDIDIKNGWSDDEVSSWLDRLDTIEIATRGARTILRTMTGGRTEKEIYSEELLQKVVDLLCKITDTCIVPMVESRSSESDTSVFNITSANKKVMSQLLHSASKIMSSLLELLTREDFSEQAVTAIEFFVIRLLFVENSHTEKDSVLGVTKFENFRRTAMNIIAAIFQKYPEQRQFIIGEVLTSLQKLPTAKVHGRQFKLGDGSRLQLVSVLLVRLVQTSGTRTATEKRTKRILPDAETKSSGEESDDDEDADGEKVKSDLKRRDDDEDFDEVEEPGGINAPVPTALINNAKKLYDSAGSSAQHIVKFLVGRASTASKSGDQPHRHLLDMFVEDLVTVLNYPEWPAAELLLRALVSTMVEIVQSKDSTAPAKTMALETLGTMAAAILDVNTVARQVSRGLEIGESNIDEQLTQQLEDHSENNLEITDLADWNGPFRVVLEFLEDNSSDPQTTSAKGYYLTQWTKFVLWGSKSTNESPDNVAMGISRRSHALNLCKLLYNGKWSNTEDFEQVSYPQCRLAYLLTLLNVGFCRAFGHILNVLVQSCSSDQTTVKTRSLKSVTQLLEKDPLLLDRVPQVRNLMFKCITDSSTMVRDNTLTLISKCITFKPALELEFIKHILLCTNDAAIGIRKRAIRTLKEIYSRGSAPDSKPPKDLRPIVADCILQRVEDQDESTAELAKQTVEEIWLAPHWTSLSATDASVQDKFVLKEQVSLIIQTVQRNPKLGVLMEAFLRYSMAPKSKNSDQSTRVCKAFVAAAFDGIIDSTELPGEPEQRHILQTLTIFARANPKLFSQQQLAHLQPYISDLTSSDDVNLFRWIVIIFRCVLPILPTVQKEFLKKIQDDLLKNVTKLAKAELNEAASCLWTINGVLQNIDRLVNVEISVLTNLRKLEAAKLPQADLSPAEQQNMKKVQRLIHLAGHFGRHCDFQSQSERFKTSLPWLAGDLVAGKIVGAIKPFAAKHQPTALRAVALESIGMVCQAWPRNFTQADVARLFLEVLRGDSPVLQKIVLTSFRDFFATQDTQFSAVALSDEKDPLSGGKLGGSMTASDNDSAASLIAQGFLKDVLRIALSSQDDDALTATEVVASITRQGLVHPRECGPALVALETSENAQIAEVALQQHYNLHQQHESLFEREYMRAIHEAFLYQKNIVHDSKGFTKSAFKSKLHSMYEVVKTSKSKYQAKFLSYYCAKMDFDPAKLDVSPEVPPHFEYARFLAENLAFFEYGRVEDIIQAIGCIEKIVGGTGAGIAHSINTEIFQVTLDPETGAPMQVPEGTDQSIGVAPERLRLLTAASMVLSMLWEVRTYVRRLWNVNTKDTARRGDGSKGKGGGGSSSSTKESHRAPTKAANSSTTLPGDKVTDAIARVARALDSRDLALRQCREFADLLAIDSEVKVSAGGADGDEDLDLDALQLQQLSPSEDDDSVLHASGGSRLNKRRRSASIGGTPSKKKRNREKDRERERERVKKVESNRKSVGAEGEEWD